MQLLLRHGAAMDACNTDDATPLHFAAQRGHLEACTRLLDHGAKVPQLFWLLGVCGTLVRARRVLAFRVAGCDGVWRQGGWAPRLWWASAAAVGVRLHGPGVQPWRL
jgi:Ankyrin repeats (many copies)